MTLYELWPGFSIMIFAIVAGADFVKLTGNWVSIVSIQLERRPGAAQRPEIGSTISNRSAACYNHR